MDDVMAQKDVTEKLLQDYTDVFADIANALMFNGEQIIRPDALMPAAVLSTYHADDDIRMQERDISKYWMDQEIKIALVGLENESGTDRHMPIRIIGYDGASYRDQLNKIRDVERENTRRRKKAEESGKVVPDLLHVPEIHPVVTLVLYFGDKPWAGPRTLHDCMEIPEVLVPYTGDYPINLFSIAFLTDEQVALFHSDFKIVADYLVRTRRGEYNISEASEAASNTLKS